VPKIRLSNNFIRNVVKLALNEDLYPSGDITSTLIKSKKNVSLRLISNQLSIIGGLNFAKQAFKLIDKKIKFNTKKKEGSFVKKGNVVAIIKGDAQKILIGERVALNFISHISGVATKTYQFVKLVKGTKCKICCTRKTIPNLRVIQRYAVKLGGGTNHRFNLSEEYLIKDNHIAISDIKNLVNLAIKNKKGKKITVEVDSLVQLKKILGLKFNTVLFDNMNIKNLKTGVKIAKKYYETEASGNINLKNVKKVAATGVSRISVGAITHSAPAIDLKFEILK
jgi:nicotinate-nucleotide pyrophosphorylase (carboxylating)